ncbi:MAG: hypothetical protein NTX53_03465 [candidate division WOR-3 bacterium]|nr:hypothetical protein [candidate division WOR-3 bacterium]
MERRFRRQELLRHRRELKDILAVLQLDANLEATAESDRLDVTIEYLVRGIVVSEYVLLDALLNKHIYLYFITAGLKLPAPTDGGRFTLLQWLIEDVPTRRKVAVLTKVLPIPDRVVKTVHRVADLRNGLAHVATSSVSMTHKFTYDRYDVFTSVGVQHLIEDVHNAHDELEAMVEHIWDRKVKYRSLPSTPSAFLDAFGKAECTKARRTSKPGSP